MIAGTLIIEDMVLNFKVLPSSDAAPRIRYSVSANLTGEEETKVVRAESFMLALGIALNWNGEVPSNATEAYSDAESVQPENTALRFIP